MKILHTADIHIREYDDVRWQALEAVVALAKTNAVEVLAISGDLFDSDADAHQLRPKIRAVFDGLPCRVLIIPGNHDAAAYSEGVFLGDSVTVIRDLLSPVDVGDITFWGFPFAELRDDEILDLLSAAGEKADPDRSHVLLFHGELYDIIGGWTQYGEEGRQRYMPVKLSYFQRLPFQYVLAGHFHSNFAVYEIQKDQYFVYSGSPVSVTRRETGVRSVNLFEIGNPPQPHPLNTFYFEKLSIFLDPFSTDTPNKSGLQTVAARIKEIPENAIIQLEISGYINGKELGQTETEFGNALKQLLSRRGGSDEIIKMEFHDIQEIISDDLFQRFKQRLKTRANEPAEKQKILDLAVKAMMTLG